MTKQLIVWMLLLPLVAGAQLSDDFSDGDFTQNPVWSGTESKFIVNAAYQLQLNDAAAASAWLSTPYSITGDTEWRFWIRLAFSASANNYCDVYLISDSQDLSSTANGYFLRFGEAGSNDAIELFRKQSGTTSSVCRGTDGLIAGSFALWVKVIRKQNGDWKLFVDPTGGGIWQQETSGSDATFAPGGYVGLLCTYTASNATKIYFDEMVISEEVPDTQPPVLLSIAAPDPFTLSLGFDEAVAAGPAGELTNFFVDGGIGNPAQAGYGLNASQLQLQFLQAFEVGHTYQLSISHMEDPAGNEAGEILRSFTYYEAAQNDVVINEIMADPSPVVGLPEWEFVELANTTSVPIDLNDWVFVAGTSEKPIGQVIIPPGGYLILAHENARFLLSPFGPFYGFSGFQLTNAGQELRLISKQGQLISSVTYSDSWYGSSAKAEGGWSLEQIDPTNPCGGKQNWTAAVSATGGSPGSVNSVFAITTLGPRPERLQLLNDSSLQLWFDQQMDPLSLMPPEAYTVKPGIWQPSTVSTDPDDRTTVMLAFGHAFTTGTVYELVPDSSLMNCAGRHLASGSTLFFGKPEEAMPNDIVINEILFNPLDDGADYVELYNRSAKVIDLEQYWLADISHSPPNQPDTSRKAISANSLLMLPGQYLAFTPSATMVLKQYQTPHPGNIIEMASFPSYTNTSGTAALISKQGPVIDVFSYDENMHFPLLTSVEGVSLERIHYDRPSNDQTNWHSAAETAGFGTPACQNSMLAETSGAKGKISIVPPLFSPDGDGRDDITSIVYLFDKPGYTLNIHIFDGSGQHIRHLVKSRLVEQEGAVSWDGTNEGGSRVAVGVYVVYGEIFDMEGTTQHFKEAVVVATR